MISQVRCGRSGIEGSPPLPPPPPPVLAPQPATCLHACDTRLVDRSRRLAICCLVQVLDKMITLDSIVLETLRLTSGSIMMRKVTRDTTLSWKGSGSSGYQVRTAHFDSSNIGVCAMLSRCASGDIICLELTTARTAP